jgi:diadenosine tetraphosphate (Ap4A) HIT family hydrolase
MSDSANDAQSCDFCAIARGEDSTVEVVCAAEAWVAFFPINPATPGHTLIIPRKHVPDLWSAEPELGADLMNAVIRVGRAITSSLQPEGMNLITSAGTAAEQTVFHLHLHVVPRWRRDGFGDIWPPGKRYQDAQLENVAEKIRTACGFKSHTR